MSIRRNAQGASSLGEINDRLREVLLIGQRHGGIDGFGGFGGVETLSVGGGEKRDRPPCGLHVDVLLANPIAPGTPPDTPRRVLSSHLLKVVDEHVTRIKLCYASMFRQVRQVFNDFELVNHRDILTHYATLFVAYYLTVAISPSFRRGLAPHTSNIPADFWVEKLHAEFKDNFDVYLNDLKPQFNVLTIEAVHFVWWMHGFKEVCKRNAITQPLATSQLEMVAGAIETHIVSLSTTDLVVPAKAPETDADDFATWRDRFKFSQTYSEVAGTFSQTKNHAPLGNGFWLDQVAVYQAKPNREKALAVFVKLFSTRSTWQHPTGMVSMLVYKEISIMQNLQNKQGDGSDHLLSVYTPPDGKPWVFFENNEIYMVMEACLYDLFNWRIRHGVVTKNADNPTGILAVTEPVDRKSILRQLATALQHMHSVTGTDAAVVHMDVKLENVFVVRERVGDEEMLIKLADFGHSTYTTTGNDDKLNNGSEFMNVGTDGYVAPEVCREKRTGTAADMYSAGILHAHLLVDLWKTDTFTALLKSTTNEYRANKTPNVQDGLLPFMGNCNADEWSLLSTQLSYDPKKRLSAADLLQNLKKNQFT